jgi:hypothetical protein
MWEERFALKWVLLLHQTDAMGTEVYGLDCRLFCNSRAVLLVKNGTYQLFEIAGIG